MAGDAIKTDGRSAEQILKEDFMVLPPGAMVGFEDTYFGCVVSGPGVYEVSSEYSAQDYYMDQVIGVASKIPVLQGQFRSSPVRFQVK